MEVSEKHFLNKKRNNKEIFKVSKASEEDENNKKQKTIQTTEETNFKTEDKEEEEIMIDEYISEEPNKFFEEYDKCQDEFNEKVKNIGIDFSKFKNMDYTDILYNNLKEIKDNDDFKEEVKKFLEKTEKSSDKYFKAKLYQFITERKEILEKSEKYGMKWYKNYVKTRKENIIDKDINYDVENFNRLSQEEKEEIIIIGILINSFEVMEKEEEKFDVSINKEKEQNKKYEIKIGLQNFNLKEFYLITFIDSIKFNNKITEIDLSMNDLSQKACFWIGTFFKYNTKKIKLLNLARCSLDNKCLNMLVIGATHANDNLNEKQIYLEKLILRDNENIKDDNNSDNEYPLSLIVEKFLIKNLNLCNTKIGNGGLKKLSETFLKLLNNKEGKKCILEILNLFNIGLKNEESLETLGDVVAHEKSNLQTLILTKNSITCPKTSCKDIPKYFQNFMEKIGESKSLKELCLLKCEIGKNDNDIEIICKMLEKNKYLKSLRLFDNLINDEEDFLKILKLFSEYKDELKNKSLKALELSKNHCNLRIDESFLNIIDNLNLEYLDINQNKIDEREKDIFRKRSNAIENIKIIY